MSKNKNQRIGDFFAHEPDEYYLHGKEHATLKDALDWCKRKVANDDDAAFYITESPPGDGSHIRYYICVDGCFSFERRLEQIGKAL